MDGFNSPSSLPVLENGHATNGIHKEVEGDYRVFMLSAKDENTVKAMIINLKEYLSSQLPLDSAVLTKNLAYTLGQHRSSFPWVAATSAQSLPKLIENLDAKKSIPTYSAKVPRLGFVFNGQGAQWYAMGRELINVYPIFRASLKEADQCIKQFGAQWSLTGEHLHYFVIRLRAQTESTPHIYDLRLPFCLTEFKTLYYPSVLAIRRYSVVAATSPRSRCAF